MAFVIEYSRYILPCIAVLILLGCCSSLFSKRPKLSIVAFLVNSEDGVATPIRYWETSIGRSKSCDIVLDYATVSRFHAVISRRKGKWVVDDTDSKTGIYINGEKVEGRGEIRDGDTLMFGNVSYYFSSPDFGRDKKDKKRYFPALVSQNNGNVFVIREMNCTIGREKTCNIYLNLKTVSRMHAELTYTKGKWIIKNYSANGVYVNGQAVFEQATLNDRDIIDIGGAIIRFDEFYEEA